MKTNDNFSNYYLYIDECGDHQLEKFNPNFPILLYAVSWFQAKILTRWKQRSIALNANTSMTKV